MNGLETRIFKMMKVHEGKREPDLSWLNLHKLTKYIDPKDNVKQDGAASAPFAVQTQRSVSQGGASAAQEEPDGEPEAGGATPVPGVCFRRILSQYSAQLSVCAVLLKNGLGRGCCDSTARFSSTPCSRTLISSKSLRYRHDLDCADDATVELIVRLALLERA